MVVFIDTSALYALIDKRDGNHARAFEQWVKWLENPVDLVTSNYVVIESVALIQRRLGIEALKAFRHEILPLVEIHWLSEALHDRGLDMVIDANHRRLSLVDCTSFLAMRQLEMNTAFAFDAHFAEQGFTLLPPPSDL